MAQTPQIMPEGWRPKITKSTFKNPDRPVATFHPVSADRKLAPIGMQRYNGPGRIKLRPVPIGPYVSATYAAIGPTCPNSCMFKDNGCYVQVGFTGPMSRKLDANAASRGLNGVGVALEEADLIRRAFGGRRIPQDGGRNGRSGRDMRLHIGGETYNTKAADLLAGATDDWRRRGGGRVWAYTHNWPKIKRAAFGPISVLASVENPRDVDAALSQGYVPAVVVREFPSDKPFRYGGMDVMPCPAETRGRTCVSCRLCLDADKLSAKGMGIGFVAHGTKASKLKRKLPLVGIEKQQEMAL